MVEPDDGSLAALVSAADAGDPGARDDLFAALYDELHRLARHHVRRSGGPVTLGATTLLHEAWLAISRRDGVAFPDQRSFLAYASRAMRGLVIDYVRTRRALKRGGDLTFLPLTGNEAPAGDVDEMERLGVALEELSTLDAGLAELVDLKFFCGLTFTDIAALRGVSERTVQRDWAKARLLLHRALTDEA